jgi:putative NIF3 family GTP cyclohydrolase 1 type 2
MPASVADIIKVMGVIAPASLAEDWDNVGLQVGQMDWPVKTVWIALDPSPDIVAAACQKKVNLLITHHPLIYRLNPSTLIPLQVLQYLWLPSTGWPFLQRIRIMTTQLKV